MKARIELNSLRNLRKKCLLGAFFSILLLGSVRFSAQAQGDSIPSPNQKKWLGFSSGITVSAQFYRNNTNDPRQQPFMYSISGSPAVNIKGFSIPFQVIYSNQVFSVQQPFNQFGIAPTFKYGTVYLGTSSMRFSNYTMTGQRFTGLGADLQLKWLRVGGMYGRLRKQVTPVGLPDTPNTFLNESENQSYRRRGYAMKIGFGKRENFFDLIYFKGGDVLPKNYNKNDWTVKPVENAIFGVNSSLKIAKKFILKNDWAVSAFTRNTLSDTITIENEGLRKIAENILLPTNSTNIRIAGESSIKFLHKVISPSFSYKRIELDYTSVGSYYFLTDIQQYTGGLSLNLVKNKLQISGSYGRQSDNLQDQKLRTSYRNIGSMNVNINPSPKWGVSLVYTNFGITQSPLPRALTDTTRFTQVSNSFTVIPRVNIFKEKVSHTVVFVAGYNAMNNLGSPLGDAANLTAYNLNLSYNIQFVKTFFNAGISPTTVVSETAAGTFVARGVNLNGGKGFYKNVLNTNIGFGYFANSFNGTDNGHTLTQSLSVSCAVPKWPVASFSLQGINNNTKDQTASPSFREWIANISLSYQF